MRCIESIKFFKLLGIVLVIELSRRRLYDFGVSSIWLCLWLIIGCTIYWYCMYNLYAVKGFNSVFGEKLLPIEIGIIFIPTVFFYLLSSNQSKNQFGDSSVQLISRTQSISYLNDTISLENKNGILEYIKDIYIRNSLCYNGRTKRVKVLMGIGSLSMVVSLIINLISILFMIKNETGIEILTPISMGIFYVLYFYTILSLLTLCIRRLHDSFYSGIWLI